MSKSSERKLLWIRIEFIRYWAWCWWWKRLWFIDAMDEIFQNISVPLKIDATFIRRNWISLFEVLFHQIQFWQNISIFIKKWKIVKFEGLQILTYAFNQLLSDKDSINSYKIWISLLLFTKWAIIAVWSIWSDFLCQI